MDFYFPDILHFFYETSAISVILDIKDPTPSFHKILGFIGAQIIF